MTMECSLDHHDFISRVYAGEDFLLFITNRLNSSNHQHPALQINISLSGETISVNNNIDSVSGECVLIGANQPHGIISQCHWQAVLLLSAEHPLAGALAQDYLSGKPMVCIDKAPGCQLKNCIIPLAAASPPLATTYVFIAQLFQTLIDAMSPLAARSNPRIGRVVSELRRHGNHRLTHTLLADAAALSSSHLSHLFRQQTGIALRRYKLWRRTMEGTHLILQGRSITEASIESGFADTAHFSRSFKQQFGISPSALRSHAQEVIWLEEHIKSGVIL